MIILHPDILSKEGKPQFAVLPYDEFLKVKEALRMCDMESSRCYGGFFENLTADELAKRQGVNLISDTTSLAWTGDLEDWEGFEESVEQWRNEYPLT
jgi:hypothetical protein